MKKILSIILSLFIFTSCYKDNTSNKEINNGVAPSILINDINYFSYEMPINELPSGFEYAGTLSKEQANNTDLKGNKFYADPNDENKKIIYVYQECGTPITGQSIDTTKRQWAYCGYARKIDAVKVNGEIYYTTNKEVSDICGLVDGEITSSTSLGLPSKDNESNFGITGEDDKTIEYQFIDEDSLLIHKDGKWIMFKKETINYDNQIADLPLGMKVSVVSLKDGLLTLKIDNQSGYEMGFDKYGQLQKQDNANWTNINMIDGAIIEDSVYTLKDLETIEIEYDLNNLYGELSKGTYRLLWEDTEVRFNID